MKDYLRAIEIDPDFELPYENLDRVFHKKFSWIYLPRTLEVIERVASQYPEKNLPAMYYTKFKAMEKFCGCSIMWLIDKIIYQIHSLIFIVKKVEITVELLNKCFKIRHSEYKEFRSIYFSIRSEKAWIAQRDHQTSFNNHIGDQQGVIKKVIVEIIVKVQEQMKAHIFLIEDLAFPNLANSFFAFLFLKPANNPFVPVSFAEGCTVIFLVFDNCWDLPCLIVHEIGCHFCIFMKDGVVCIQYGPQILFSFPELATLFHFELRRFRFYWHNFKH